jgi:hypothetical protein
MRSPANMTSRVQILDVGINKPFKDYKRSQFNIFMQATQTTLGGNKVTRELMGKGIADSWEKVSASFVLKTARKIGFIPHIP